MKEQASALGKTATIPMPSTNGRNEPISAPSEIDASPAELRAIIVTIGPTERSVIATAPLSESSPIVGSPSRTNDSERRKTEDIVMEQECGRIAQQYRQHNLRQNNDRALGNSLSC